jgi:hypothetical protein
MIIRLPVGRPAGTRMVPVLVNPGRDDLLALLGSLHPDNRSHEIRGLEAVGTYYFWDGWQGTHHGIRGCLGRHLGGTVTAFHPITVWRSRRDLLHCTFDSPPHVHAYMNALLGGPRQRQVR